MGWLNHQLEEVKKRSALKVVESRIFRVQLLLASSGCRVREEELFIYTYVYSLILIQHMHIQYRYIYIHVNIIQVEEYK